MDSPIFSNDICKELKFKEFKDLIEELFDIVGEENIDLRDIYLNHTKNQLDKIFLIKTIENILFDSFIQNPEPKDHFNLLVIGLIMEVKEKFDLQNLFYFSDEIRKICAKYIIENLLPEEKDKKRLK